MTEKQETAIRKHGEQLQAIFPATRGMDPAKLYRKLRRIECSAHHLAEQDYNGTIEVGVWLKKRAAFMEQITDLLDHVRAGVPVILNSDPRGYAIRIPNEYMSKHVLALRTDIGGYGIGAPEIGKDGAG